MGVLFDLDRQEVKKNQKRKTFEDESNKILNLFYIWVYSLVTLPPQTLDKNPFSFDSRPSF